MLTDLIQYMEIRGYRFEEANVLASCGLEFWHSLVHDADRNPISAGFHSDRLMARKIAVAEFLERKKYREISRSDQKVAQEWGLDVIPTACGFAAGFNRRNTMLRSLAEACERWVMSKWIDDHLFIEQIGAGTIGRDLDPVSNYFVNQFDFVNFYSKSVVVNIGSEFFKFEIGQTMAFKDGGVFPGSSAQLAANGSVWQHALLESFRHHLLVKNNSDRGDYFPDNKIRFFAYNAEIASEQILVAHTKLWPIPQIRLVKCESFEGDSYFVARSIIDGWKSWSDGPLERFLY